MSVTNFHSIRRNKTKKIWILNPTIFFQQRRQLASDEVKTNGDVRQM